MLRRGLIPALVGQAPGLRPPLRPPFAGKQWGRGLRGRAITKRHCVLSLILLSSACIGAATLPDRLAPNKRQTDEPLQVTADKPIWDEYGLTAAEQASYGPFTITAYRFKDPTGAFAASEWLAAKETAAMPLGNYVVTCSGNCPAPPQLTQRLAGWTPPGINHGPYPLLPSWLPAAGVVPHSERYVLGPASLAAFAPRIPAEAAAFQFSPEAQLATYRRNSHDEILVVFSYPTPGIARQQLARLSNVSGVTSKRNGPLVGLVFDAPDLNAARQLLNGVGYSAAVTSNQPMPLRITPQSAAQLVLAGMKLAGILLLFCLFSGLLFGLVRVLSRRFGQQNADESMVVLHLGDR